MCFSCVKGLCEFCVFPFLNNQFIDPSIEEIADDCVNLADLPGKSFCPTAVKEDNTPFGIPYQWSCPVSDHQLHPSCYESPDNGRHYCYSLNLAL